MLKIVGLVGHVTIEMFNEQYAHLRLDMQNEITRIIGEDLLSGLKL